MKARPRLNSSRKLTAGAGGLEGGGGAFFLFGGVGGAEDAAAAAVGEVVHGLGVFVLGVVEHFDGLGEFGGEGLGAPGLGVDAVDALEVLGEALAGLLEVLDFLLHFEEFAVDGGEGAGEFFGDFGLAFEELGFLGVEGLDFQFFLFDLLLALVEEFELLLGLVELGVEVLGEGLRAEVVGLEFELGALDVEVVGVGGVSGHCRKGWAAGGIG